MRVVVLLALTDRPPFLARSSAEQLVNVAGIVNGTLTSIDSGGTSPSSLFPSPPLIAHDVPFLRQSLWPPSPLTALTIDEFPQSPLRFAVPCLESPLNNLLPRTNLQNATTARVTAKDSQPNTPLTLTPRALPLLNRPSVILTIALPSIRRVVATPPTPQSPSPGRRR